MGLVDELASRSVAFLDGLDGSRRAQAALPFDGKERRTWAYWPAPRRGVALWSLDRAQTKSAHRLLAAVLPPAAFARAVAIMGLDEILDRAEGFSTDSRHRDDYWLTVFGEPGGDTWALRFEGHHVSLHVTVAGGEVRMTPLFLGANPAVVHDGSHVVLAPMAPEERLGFDLLHALSAEQRATAVVAARAPDDIVTRNEPRIGPLEEKGVALSALRGGGAAAARALVDLYLGRFPSGANRPDPDGLRFAWAGAAEPGVGHYYRLSGPRLLVELDNTQNGANHVHTVVRDPGADFGDDLLAIHHRRHHSAPDDPSSR